MFGCFFRRAASYREPNCTGVRERILLRQRPLRILLLAFLIMFQGYGVMNGNPAHALKTKLELRPDQAGCWRGRVARCFGERPLEAGAEESPLGCPAGLKLVTPPLPSMVNPEMAVLLIATLTPFAVPCRSSLHPATLGGLSASPPSARDPPMFRPVSGGPISVRNATNTTATTGNSPGRGT